MKKRLLSLVLCLAMLLPTLVLFTSCDQEDKAEPGTIKPMTIVIAMMTDEKTNEAGIEATEKALNAITEGNLNTHIELKLYTEAEYYAELEKALLARREAVKNGDESNSLGEVTDVIYDEEKNREVTAYPEPYENQIDIFFVDSMAKLESYRLWKQEDASDKDYAEDPGLYSDSLVSTLDEYMEESAPLLSKYLSAGLLNAGKIYLANTGELCAIPSNSIYDSPEYMIIDKKLFDSYSYNMGEVTNLVSLENFLVDVVTDYPEITALYNLGSMSMLSLTGKHSAICQGATEGVSPDAVGLEPKTMFGSAVFRSSLVSINNYAPINGKYPIPGLDISGAEKGKFAVGFVRADAEEIKAYEEDYYTIMTQKAVITNEQAHGNMFAVSAYTSAADRCLEVINLLQTNKEAHNILVYGQENVTYVVEESTGMIKRETEGEAVYVMDIHKSGNLFLTLPNTDMTERELAYAANDWALAKTASRTAFFSAYTGMELMVFEGEEIFDDPTTPDVDESNNPLNLPTKAEIDFLESAYNAMLGKIFGYQAVKDEVGENGKLVYANYSAYIDALDAELRAMTMEGSDVKIVGSQLAATTGTKNIYRQYMDWKKIHYSSAS
jgi:hypothetical protein